MYSFEGTIDRYDFGKYFYTVVYLPADASDALPLAEFPRLRVDAAVDDHWVRAALMPDTLGSKQTAHLIGKDSRPAGTRIWYLMVPKKILKALDKDSGDAVSVRVTVADQDEVDVPRELTERLRENPRLREIWDELTPGKKRGLVHPINTARSRETRLKRVDALEETLFDL